MRPLYTGSAGREIDMWKAIIRDVQFWIPVAVLVAGIGLLIWIH